METREEFDKKLLYAVQHKQQEALQQEIDRENREFIVNATNDAGERWYLDYGWDADSRTHDAMLDQMVDDLNSKHLEQWLTFHNISGDDLYSGQKSVLGSDLADEEYTYLINLYERALKEFSAEYLASDHLNLKHVLVKVADIHVDLGNLLPANALVAEPDLRIGHLGEPKRIGDSNEDSYSLFDYKNPSKSIAIKQRAGEQNCPEILSAKAESWPDRSQEKEREIRETMQKMKDARANKSERKNEREM